MILNYLLEMRGAHILNLILQITFISKTKLADNKHINSILWLTLVKLDCLNKEKNRKIIETKHPFIFGLASLFGHFF